MKKNREKVKSIKGGKESKDKKEIRKRTKKEIDMGVSDTGRG